MYIPWDHLSDLADLWVIKIKSLWSFARVVHRNHVNRAQNADQAARTCERFVYSIVKIIWLSNVTDIFREIQEVRKGLRAFYSWLCFLVADWLGEQFSDHMFSMECHRHVKSAHMFTVYSGRLSLDEIPRYIFLYIVWLASCKYESLFRACTQ